MNDIQRWRFDIQNQRNVPIFDASDVSDSNDENTFDRTAGTVRICTWYVEPSDTVLTRRRIEMERSIVDVNADVYVLYAVRARCVKWWDRMMAHQFNFVPLTPIVPSRAFFTRIYTRVGIECDAMPVRTPAGASMDVNTNAYVLNIGGIRVSAVLCDNGHGLQNYETSDTVRDIHSMTDADVVCVHSTFGSIGAPDGLDDAWTSRRPDDDGPTVDPTISYGARAQSKTLAKFRTTQVFVTDSTSVSSIFRHAMYNLADIEIKNSPSSEFMVVVDISS
jgi:hypothetical protein